MRRLLRIFAKYALVAAAIFALQWFPVPGGFLMLFLGIFWIGVLVHVFMIQIAIMSIMGALPRVVLVLPVTFYAAGLAVGLSSDIPASSWQSRQQWLRIDKQVPSDTLDLAFAALINHLSIELSHQDRAFQPEKSGFELFILGSGPHPEDRLVIFQSDAKQCPSGAMTLTDRCFTTSPMGRPSSYVLIGGKGDGCPLTGADFIHFSWGTILPNCEPIRLHIGDDEKIVGRLSGAVIQKRSYFLFPTAGCGLVDNPSSWRCQWYVSPLWRNDYVGYRLGVNGSSRNATSILMSALAQLRGQTASP